MLVTGAAGFIGFHLGRVLAQNKNNFIVGIDNYNDYYDVRLKIVSHSFVVVFAGFVYVPPG